MSSQSLTWHGPRVRIHLGTEPGAEIRSVAETPVIEPEVTFFEAGPHRLPCALLLPRGHVPGSGRLPVLCDPYGGPAAQMVVASRNAYLTAQWFADQGFAVLIADGRGTPGRGPAWDRSIHFDEATPNVEDQVAALQAAAEVNPDLDLTRVGIRGWSHGGYLAALAVLRRPDVFKVAAAGAPVVDWLDYDTHYTERYLDLPDVAPEAYRAASLLTYAPALERPLLIVHGTADDNVYFFHSLKLADALFRAGRRFTFFPLAGVTHQVPSPDLRAQLWQQIVDFLFEHL
jgi:dipeptidyl-peptidase-4